MRSLLIIIISDGAGKSRSLAKQNKQKGGFKEKFMKFCKTLLQQLDLNILSNKNRDKLFSSSGRYALFYYCQH